MLLPVSAFTQYERMGASEELVPLPLAIPLPLPLALPLALLLPLLPVATAVPDAVWIEAAAERDDDAKGTAIFVASFLPLRLPPPLPPLLLALWLSRSTMCASLRTHAFPIVCCDAICCRFGSRQYSSPTSAAASSG